MKALYGAMYEKVHNVIIVFKLNQIFWYLWSLLHLKFVKLQQKDVSNNYGSQQPISSKKTAKIFCYNFVRKIYRSDRFKFENCPPQIHHLVKLSDDSLSDISRKDNKKTSIFCDQKKNKKTPNSRVTKKRKMV